MGDFRSGGRSFGGRSGGRSFGGGGRFGGGRGRFGDREPREMHDAVCSKCKKECQVPFKPTGDKPVLCSNCFRDSDSRGSGRNGSSGGMSQEQFKQINSKLDKILDILEEIEFEDDEDIEGEDDKVISDDKDEELVDEEDEKIVEDEAPVEDKSEDSEDDLGDNLEEDSPEEPKAE